MDNIEKFSELLQGRLDDETERRLFSDLSLDDEMRRDFKCFAAITGNIKNNMAAFAPSAEAKSRIFAKAGFSLPVIGEITKVGVPKSSGLLKTKLFASFASGTAMTIATAAIIFLFFIPKNNGTVKQEISGKTAKIEIPKVISSTIPENQEMPKTIIKYIYLKEKPVEEITQKESNNNNEQKNLILTKADNATNYNINHLRDQNSSKCQYIMQDNRTIPLITDHSTGLSIEYKGEINRNIPKETIEPATPSKLNNSGITLLYSLTNNFKTGVEARQETFFTEYTGTEADGSTYKYTQQPNLTTFSAIVRYEPFSYNNLILSYLQLGIGYNRGGYVLRPSMGVEYRAYTNISFLFGLEYSRMWFSHQNSWFSADKAGFSYGISYGF